MFIHNINPVLLSIGPLSIKYYGLVYAIGFLAAYFLLRWVAKNDKIKNLTTEKADTLTIYLVLGAIIGARFLLFVFYHPGTLISDPLEVFRIWHGGMSFHGGMIGAVIAGLLFCKKHKVSFYQLADLLVIPTAFFLFIGRIANFINGELVGIVAKSNFCIDYSQSQYIVNPPQGCRVPSQLYESAKNLLIFFTLSILYTKKKLKDGVLFWLFVTMYGVLRFIINFWRENLSNYFGLSGGQFWSLIMAILGIVMLIVMHVKKKPVQQPVRRMSTNKVLKRKNNK
ncbi:MAG: prolipoprotein diacylglyceryl transferase [Nanoarchaeota archaeon]|nr:prolipoprotein diacylglyceryl transferase [Nanoarchaeota archaeon]MBU1321322.1 prolipoprotein diacylglyceryl transferase [Nanoarchaeota archaeon]MBU1597529.1 prolipoprotein diacylglyceryl transferase [Nanoarchaeota archaeon]MBU2441130.1 prolipoprotein diacylglyceryl transferase [Nanoarchaeota archaeon]